MDLFICLPLNATTNHLLLLFGDAQLSARWRRWHRMLGRTFAEVYLLERMPFFICLRQVALQWNKGVSPPLSTQ